MNTKHAPAERASKEEVLKQINTFKDDGIADKFLSKIPVVFMIVNKERQVIYMNQGAIEFTGLEDVTEVIGQRPGEICACIHSTDEEGG